MNELVFHIDNVSENLDGWIFHKNGKKILLDVRVDDKTYFLEPSLPRYDVNAKHGILSCGFSLHLASHVGSINILITAIVESNSQIIYKNTVNIENRSKSTEVALGYHFLINDSNKTRDLLSKGRPVNKGELEKITSAVNVVAEKLSKYSIDFCTYVIPEKNHVLKFLEPTFNISDERIAYQLSQAKMSDYTYLLDFLLGLSIEERLSIYSKGDNHINFLGIQKILIEYFENRIKSFKPPEIRIALQVGDLSKKVDETFVVDLGDSIVIDDKTEQLINLGMQLTGSEIKARNTEAPLGTKLFVLGTSSARNFVYALSPSFSSIDMIWGTSTNIDRIIEGHYTHFYFIIPERILYSHTLLNLIQST